VIPVGAEFLDLDPEALKLCQDVFQVSGQRWFSGRHGRLWVGQENPTRTIPSGASALKLVLLEKGPG
jgi:hypothetical protein